MRLLTLTFRTPLDKVATSNKCLHGGCKTWLGYNVLTTSLLGEHADNKVVANCKVPLPVCELQVKIKK